MLEPGPQRSNSYTSTTWSSWLFSRPFSPYTGQIRQLDSNVIPEPSRGHSLSFHVHANMEASQLVHTSPDLHLDLSLSKPPLWKRINLIIFPPPDIFFPSLTSFSGIQEDKLWCPVRILKFYIARTRQLRGDATQLFITTVHPHHPASVTTIASYTTCTSRAAYVAPNSSGS